jgi:hypothetical protein
VSFETIICDVRPPVAELVLNRPEDGNTFTAQLPRSVRVAWLLRAAFGTDGLCGGWLPDAAGWSR